MKGRGKKYSQKRALLPKTPLFRCFFCLFFACAFWRCIVPLQAEPFRTMQQFFLSYPTIFYWLYSEFLLAMQRISTHRATCKNRCGKYGKTARRLSKKITVFQPYPQAKISFFGTNFGGISTCFGTNLRISCSGHRTHAAAESKPAGHCKQAGGMRRICCK